MNAITRTIAATVLAVATQAREGLNNSPDVGDNSASRQG